MIQTTLSLWIPMSSDEPDIPGLELCMWRKEVFDEPQGPWVYRYLPSAITFYVDDTLHIWDDYQ